MYVNVTDTISWQGHHDRVMQLNWLYFCGICQMMPLKVWPNTALGCNHQSICMPSYSLYVQLLWYPMYYLGGMKARVQNHKRWPLHYHCTLHMGSCHSISTKAESITCYQSEVGHVTWLLPTPRQEFESCMLYPCKSQNGVKIVTRLFTNTMVEVESSL